MTYTYGDSDWPDLLTVYNGSPITHDDIGNPLSYRGWTFTWQGGRQLAAARDGTTSLSFVYNESGLRTEKAVGNDSHRYVYRGSTLVAEITDDYALYFHHDARGEIVGFTYASGNTQAEYFYRKNLQGDVIGIVDASGNSVAEYRYDAWGKILEATGTMANINPIRYRGYYFDQETGLYYVSSRYYDPEICRWINADDVSNLGANSDFASVNLFSYCGNNPVNRSDNGGEFWHIVVGAVIGAAISTVASVISQVRTDGSVDPVTTLIAAGSGAIGGALTASGVPVGGQIVGGALIGMAGDYLTQSRKIQLGKQTTIDKSELVVSTIMGGVCGLVSGPGASGSSGGQKNMINLGANTIKRTWNALTNKGVKAYFSEAGKAAKYYISSTRSVTASLFSWRNLAAQIIGAAYSIMG